MSAPATCRDLDRVSGALERFVEGHPAKPSVGQPGWSDTPLIEHVRGKVWQLHRTITYVSGRGGHWTIPAGFHSDGYSRPWWVGWIIPRWGPGTRAALLHDALYRYGPSVGASRATADALLYEAMRYEGIAAWRCYSVWLGVRAGGWWPWRRLRREGSY